MFLRVASLLSLLFVTASLLADEPRPVGMKPMEFGSAQKRRAVLVDARAQALPCEFLGPFVALGDGGILAVTGNRMRISKDQGETWSENALPLPADKRFDIRHNALLRTRDGTVIVAFGNEAEEKGKVWVNGEPPDDCQLPVYVMRSTDDGKTWHSPQRIYEGWTRDTRCMIQLRSSRIVLASSKSVPNPGRQQALCLFSDDDGKTWKKSEPIDLGTFANPPTGKGDGHDGAHHGTLVELQGGRIWTLLSCRKGLCQAFSDDGGLSWKDKGPSNISSAGFAPATLARLQSGRLVCFWNPLVEKDDPNPKALAARINMSFSEDDGKSWSLTTLLIHDLPSPGTSLHAQWREHVVRVVEVFEIRPGELWVTTHRPDIRIRISESDFVKDRENR